MPPVSHLPHYFIETYNCNFVLLFKIPFRMNKALFLMKNANAYIEWWKHCELLLPSGSASISEQQPIIALSTDASNSGWGDALSSGPTASGSWSEQESQHHINYLELKAIKLCILSFIHLNDNSFRILSDDISPMLT